MTSEHWKRVQQIFHDTLDRVVEQRAAFLDRACDGEPELREEVLRLLHADENSDEFIEPPDAATVSNILATAPRQGEQIGSYRLGPAIASGGMGTVFRASRADDQYEQTVAIKIIRPEVRSETLLERFRNERQLLARLNHPNIARLLDGGTTAKGDPFLVMEYVDGQPIDVFCDTGRLTLDQRLRLFRSTCGAVSYAHQGLVVHRDLKPSNILVSADGQAKLLDFGIAKLLADEPAPEVTEAGSRPMTPEYASPEQVRGEPVTTSSDIYALGVLLYELLTGHRPYRLDTQERYELERAICEEQPKKPSTVVTEISQRGERQVTPEQVGKMRNSRPARLRRSLTGDLDNIVLRAMHKEPERRYASVEALDEDIRRYLDHLPVRARRDSVGYRAGKFMRRNRAAMAMLTVAVLALVCGAAGIALSESKANQEARRAQQEANRFRAMSRFLHDLLSSPAPGELGPEAKFSAVLMGAEERIRSELADQPDVEYQVRRTLGDTYNGLGMPAEAEAHYQGALQILSRSNNSPGEVAELLRRIANQRVHRGDYAQAEILYKQALDTLPETADNRARRATLLSSLGRSYLVTHDLVRAEPLLRDAVDLSRQTRFPDEQDRARILSNLATCLTISLTDLEQAEELVREALEIAERHPDQPDRWLYHFELARVLYTAGRVAEMLPGLEHVIQQQREALGPDHGDLASSLDLMGRALLESAAPDPARAEGYLREALEIHLRRHGENHPLTSMRISSLAWALKQQGRYAETIELTERMFELLGDDPEKRGDRAMLLNNVATVLLAMGRDDEAREKLEQAFATQTELYGETHPNRAPMLFSLGLIHARKGEQDQAAERLRAALAVRRVSHPEGHPDLFDYLFALAGIEMKRGDYDVAATLLEEQLEYQGSIAESAFRKGVCQLARCRLEQGFLEEAETLYQESLPSLRQLLGDADPFVQSALVELAELYEERGQPDRAAEYRALIQP